MRSGNPALSAEVFRSEATARGTIFDTTQSNVMTLPGTVVKTGVLLAMTVGGAAVSWMHIVQTPEVTPYYMWGGLLGGLVLSLVIYFKPASAGTTAPLYAIAEGFFVGAISLWVSRYAERLGNPYIVAEAAALTFGTLAALLITYSTGKVRPSENFKLGLMAATGGIGLVYAATIILGLFGVQIPYIHESGLIGIGFSIFVVIVAALNLVLDFDFIESAVEQGAPKHMEWYGAFGLLVTLVWLYIEFLRLLMKLQERK